MPDEDINETWHFRELHLFPRIIFAIGAVLFVVSVAKDIAFTRLGIAIVFAAVGYNMFYDWFRSRGKKNWDAHELIERRFRIGEIILCLLLAVVFLILFVFRGTLPLCHRPTFGFHQHVPPSPRYIVTTHL
jgi:hypothetical protein